MRGSCRSRHPTLSPTPSPIRLPPVFTAPVARRRRRSAAPPRRLSRWWGRGGVWRVTPWPDTHCLIRCGRGGLRGRQAIRPRRGVPSKRRSVFTPSGFMVAVDSALGQLGAMPTFAVRVDSLDEDRLPDASGLSSDRSRRTRPNPRLGKQWSRAAHGVSAYRPTPFGQSGSSLTTTTSVDTTP